MSHIGNDDDEYTGSIEYLFEKGYELFRGDRKVVLVLTAAAFISTTYLLTHRYPAYGAGLFLKISETIVSQNYAFPDRVIGYTRSGVPFAYPPFTFYVNAVLFDLGVSPLQLSRVLPAVVTSVAFVPYFYLARELLPSSGRAGIAAIIAAVTPMLLQWHLSAGGIVRAPAFFLLLSGLYAGIRLFRYQTRLSLVVGTVLFGVLLLTHPTYSMFFAASYILFFIEEQRSLEGLGRGLVVAAGGLLIASPWILHIVSTYGIDVFTAAAGTHGGLGAGVTGFFDRLGDPFATSSVVIVWYVFLVFGIYHFARKRQYFLPLWFGVSVFLMDEIRFAFIPGVMIISIGLTDVMPAIRARLFQADRTATSQIAITIVVLCLLVSLGGLFVANHTVTNQDSMPSFIDHEDMTAMSWAQSETPPDAEFVVIGDAAEWFPYFTNRMILVGPWGVEWKTPAAYQHQMNAFESLSDCDTARCLTTTLRSNRHHPTYLYVPKGRYTVRGTSSVQSNRMRHSLERSNRYEIQYENAGVLIVRVRLTR
jgi:Dolichyl-phosphate-mannose-protein mannosyltransferase